MLVFWSTFGDFKACEEPLKKNVNNKRIAWTEKSLVTSAILLYSPSMSSLAGTFYRLCNPNVNNVLLWWANATITPVKCPIRAT